MFLALQETGGRMHVLDSAINVVKAIENQRQEMAEMNATFKLCSSFQPWYLLKTHSIPA